MRVWTSAFLHQFLDGNPANYNALPGVLTAQPDGLFVRPTSPADQLGFPIKPGQSLDYAFERPLNQVVGVDIRLDLFFPGTNRSGDAGRRDYPGLLTDFINDVAPLLCRPVA